MQLKAVLGPVQLVFYSVGVIIGAGVYSVIGAAAGLAGHSLWLSFVIGAIVAVLTAISYAEMATSFPAAGAEYVYVRRALPSLHWAAFGIAIVILTGGSAAAATVAVAFGGYLQTFLDIPPAVSAFFLLSICTGVNVWGLREASWLNTLFTSIEVAGLVLVIAAGLTRENFAAPILLPPQPGVFAAAAVLFFVYLGFEEVANLTEEMHDPPRDLPRAIFISLGLTTTLYVLVSLAVIALASPGELASSGAPLAVALHKAWPEAVGRAERDRTVRDRQYRSHHVDSGLTPGILDGARRRNPIRLCDPGTSTANTLGGRRALLRNVDCSPPHRGFEAARRALVIFCPGRVLCRKSYPHYPAISSSRSSETVPGTVVHRPNADSSAGGDRGNHAAPGSLRLGNLFGGRHCDCPGY